MQRPHLRDLTLPELESWAEAQGLPRYRAAQLFTWVHRSGLTSTEGMTNLSKELRARLAEQCDLSGLAVDAVLTSEDGTRKLRLRCADGQAVEAVLIPAEDKLTLCISTQAGCALGCRFCATATMGLRRNLSAGEIVDQVYRAQSLLVGDERLTNLVYMGMGEPLANLADVLRSVEILGTEAGASFSPRRITISTAGLVPGIAELGRRVPGIGLAISLHATTDELRSQLMPINRRWPLAELLRVVREFPLPRRRRVTFEYLLLRGLNDAPADAKRLVRLLDGIPAKVNLLAYNPCRTDQPDLQRPDEGTVEEFAELLREKGLNATVRRSRGLDIAAACGQLALQG
ncbi:MAG: 23S rRNA (adenine(2503)-C(2))-methyltransferase RlmN [Deltaproteobacteria bacterium]|nr:23S rRNA (adenine(2503)-C(2))-methyltransferase RlmN [Deltaproteobacteria bacterium]